MSTHAATIRRPLLRPWIALLATFALMLPLLPSMSATAGEHDDPVVVALWDFEGETTDPAIDLTGNAAASGGSGLGNESFPVGNPAGTSGTAWSFNNWAQTDEPDATRYFEFAVDLTDFANVTLDFAERRSGTGPLDFEIHYSTDGTDFTQIPATVTTLPNNTSWRSHSFDFSGLDDAIAGEPSVQFRIFGYNATGATGTWRIDDVTFADTTDVPPPPPSLSLTCTAPLTITEGYAAEDSEFVRGKAITATASGGAGDYEFDVVGVNPDPAPGAVTITDVDGADAEARFSDEVPGLDPTEAPRTYGITLEATDGEGATATCDVNVRVVPVLSIGEMRGVVPDDANGRTYVSPYALGTPIFLPHSDHIAIRGVVTQRTLEENPASPFDFEGFFVQSLDAEPADIGGFEAGDPAFADGDPRSSDGVWVSTGTFSTVRPDFPTTPPQAEQYFAEPGDIVTLRGPIVEDFQQTVLANPFVVDVVTPDASGADLDDHIEVPEANPPDDVQQASVYWERLAGMQVEVPADSLVVSGNDFFSPSTSEFWVIRGDHPVALRDDPDARRVFRDYHPLANEQVLPTDPEAPGDQNGFRILLGSFGVKAAEGDPTATITPARSGDTLTEARQGGLYFSFAKYQVMVDAQPELARGHDPSARSLTAVEGFDPSIEYSVMVYNVENLYDFRSDPFSGCDLDPDVVPENQQPTSRCTPDEPGGSSVTPPFTYAPRSQAEYDAHREAIAEQILVALDAPDIITIQEAEKQDVCTPVFVESEPTASFMDCDLSPPTSGETMENTERGSGAPDTVEELALEIFIQSDGVIRYEASGDAVNGRDVRGITQAFLHRTDRVELVPVDELTDDPVLGAGEAIDIPYPEAGQRTAVAPWVLEAANPKAVNAVLATGVPVQDGGRFPQTGYVFTRPVQVGKFRIYPDGVDTDRYVERNVTSNHMSAGPDRRVEQRTEQARLNAAVAEAVRDAGGQILVTGDFNVFARPDDPFPAYKTNPNRPPTDQLAAMYERGFTNLHDVIIEEAPENTYSFIFRGISQILDHIFVDDASLEELVTARYIHVNTDYPAATPGFEPGRGASDHDPLYARFYFFPPECVDLLAGQHIPVGEVCVLNSGRDVRVTYTTTGGWSLTETHLAAAGDAPGSGVWLDERWQNRAGNPAPGRFPYTGAHDPSETTVTYTIPLEDLSLTFDETLYLAAHARVERLRMTEGAWADGQRFVDRGPWATYTTYVVR